MLISQNINPKDTIYYNGALVLQELEKIGKIRIWDLYMSMKIANKMSFNVLMLSLDWLYLLEVAFINEKGEVVLCI